MKKSLLALAALATLGSVNAAYAQSNVTVYGLIDATISTVNHADSNGDRLTGVPVAWFSGNRIGFRGAEDLGGGLKAIFKLEAEFVVGTGEMDTPGVLFNRDSWVGLQDKTFGQITLGRQNTLARDFSQVYGDAYGSKLGLEEGGFTNNNNFKQMIFYSGSATGTRYDRGLVWKKVFDNGVVAGLGYQFGNVAGAFSNNTTKSAAIGYNGSNFIVSGFVNQADVGNGLTSSTEKHKSFGLGGSYIFDLVRLNAGYFHYTAEQGALGQRKDDAYTVSAKFTPQGSFDYELGYQVMKAQNAAYNAAGTSTLNAYADASGSTATGSGKKKTLYGSTFYHLSKRTELYVAADYMKLDDGYRVGSANGFKNQTEFAMGMRTRF
ncbi:Outer membrane porin protein 32 precursor [Collimonas arenae]|uniref:Outer membrane porin protein 32 n=1 Tax=Collimonas arenae TaxID=279058 RepID=A0A0A1FGB8_9BURK|nr:porin [Collimonas arenae]AIY42770.1 Outer membrane porin protein 32 precursor [Collimonas arenae]